jgi:CHAT domain-containing protein
VHSFWRGRCHCRKACATAHSAPPVRSGPYLFSSLALADGALTLRDAAALPLAGTFVALSACETGLSRVAPGDELLGLLRGFLLAGAPAVMATLWTVDDAGTAGLMTDFYRGLVAGEPAAQALRRAQQALRAERPHPYYWAPFVLHGRV